MTAPAPIPSDAPPQPATSAGGSGGQPPGRLGRKTDFPRLLAAIDWSLRELEPHRKTRLDAIRQYVGIHYDADGSDRALPTNFIELATTIYVRALAPRAPRPTVTARVRSLRPFAAAYEAVLGQLPDEIGLAQTLRRAVLEAMFSFAVVKVGISPSRRGPGDEPFVDLVPLDRYFLDMSAQTMGQCQFEGDTYLYPAARVETEKSNFEKIKGPCMANAGALTHVE